MIRKECVNLTWSRRSRGLFRLLTGCLALAGPVLTTIAKAGPGAAPDRCVKLWASAVVVDDIIRLRDVCELRGFNAADEAAVGDARLDDAPPCGGSKIITLVQLRAALSAVATNMATVTVKGAAECIARRPADSQLGRAGNLPVSDTLEACPTTGLVTLRDAVTEFFDRELSAHGAKADLQFGRTTGQLLDMTGPRTIFQVQRRSGSALGLVDLEVEVTGPDATVQRVPLVVSVAMMRHVLVARSPINKGAAVEDGDVVTVARRFTRLEDAGLSERGPAVGLRAKRFIAGGEMIQARDLERLPLVKRGQMVEVISRVGAITIKTAAKAAGDAGYGEAVTLHAPGRKRDDLVGRVAGPRRVELNDPIKDQPGESVLVRGDVP